MTQKKLFKTGVFSLLAVIMFAVVTMLFLLSPMAEGLRTRVALARIGEAVGPGVTFRRFETNLFSRLSVDSVHVRLPGVTVEVGRIDAGYRLFELMRSPPMIRFLQLDDFQIEAAPQSSDSVQVATSTEPAGSIREALRTVRIRELTVRSAQVRWVDPPVELRVQDIILDVLESDPFVHALLMRAETVVAVRDTFTVFLNHVLLDGMLSPDTVRVDSFGLHLFGGTMTAHGSAALFTPFTGRFDFGLTGLKSDMPAAFMGASMNLPGGTVNGSAYVSGPFAEIEKLTVEMDLSWRDHEPKDPIQIRGSLKRRTVDGVLSSRDASLTFRTSFRDDSLDGAFELRLSDLRGMERWMNGLRLAGKVGLTGTVGGSIRQPRIAASIEGTGLRIQGFPVDRLEGGIRWRSGKLMFDGIRLNGNETPLASLGPHWLPAGISGRFRYSGRLDGAMDSFSADLKLHFHDAIWPGMPAVSGKAGFRCRNKQIDMDSLHVQTDSLRLFAAGRYARDAATVSAVLKRRPCGEDAGRLEADYDVSEKRLCFAGRRLSLRPLARFFSDSLALYGSADLSGCFRPDSDSFAGQFRLSVKHPVFQTYPLDSIVCAVGFDGHMLRLDTLQWYDPQCAGTLTAALPVQRSGAGWHVDATDALAGRLRIDRIDLEKLSGRIPVEISGTGRADLAFHGSLKHPGVTGRIDLCDGVFRQSPHSPPVDSIFCRLDFMDSVMTITRLDGRALNRRVALTGAVTMPLRDRLTFQSRLLVQARPIASVNGDLLSDSLSLCADIDRLPLDLFLPVQEAVESIDGTVSAHVLATRGRRLRMSGEVKACVQAMKLRGMRETWQDGVISARVDEKRAVIDSVFFRQNEGLFFGRGHIPFGGEGRSGAQIRANASKLEITLPGTLEIVLDSLFMDWTGSNDRSRLTGELMLGKTRYIQSMPLGRLIDRITRPQPPKRPGPAWMRNTAIQMRVRHSDNLWVDNNLAKLRLHPDLVVGNTLDNPVFSGRLQVISGHVYYLDRRFTLKKGILDFTDPNRNNPVIDLEAVSVFKEYETLSRIPYEITLNIFGLSNEAQFTLTSQPPLGRPDIVALLTLGITREQTTQNREQAGVSLAEALTDRAALLSSVRVSNMILKPIGTAFGLDEVSIEGNLFRFGKAWGPQLVAGKKLSERMSITYSATAGNANDQKMRLDYKLSDRWSVMGETNQKGEAGLDFKYKIKLK